MKFIILPLCALLVGASASDPFMAHVNEQVETMRDLGVLYAQTTAFLEHIRTEFSVPRVAAELNQRNPRLLEGLAAALAVLAEPGADMKAFTGASAEDFMYDTVRLFNMGAGIPAISHAFHKFLTELQSDLGQEIEGEALSITTARNLLVPIVENWRVMAIRGSVIVRNLQGNILLLTQGVATASARRLADSKKSGVSTTTVPTTTTTTPTTTHTKTSKRRLKKNTAKSTTTTTTTETPTSTTTTTTTTTTTRTTTTTSTFVEVDMDDGSWEMVGRKGKKSATAVRPTTRTTTPPIRISRAQNPRTATTTTTKAPITETIPRTETTTTTPESRTTETATSGPKAQKKLRRAATKKATEQTSVSTTKSTHPIHANGDMANVHVLRPLTEPLARQVCMAMYGAAVGMSDVALACDLLMRYPGTAEMMESASHLREQVSDIRQRIEQLRLDAHYSVDIAAQMPSLILPEIPTLATTTTGEWTGNL